MLEELEPIHGDWLFETPDPWLRNWLEFLGGGGGGGGGGAGGRGRRLFGGGGGGGGNLFGGGGLLTMTLVELVKLLF